jgi:DNA-binding winged helix-turn-helix (wHTH) protein
VSAPSPHPGRKLGIARFGVFEADLEARELRKQGHRVRIQDQPFAVLSILLERAGNIVTREELRQRLWPADTFVDFDHSLNTAVNKIREVLGDSASSPRFVETVARRGYRFLGEVRSEVDGHASAVAETPHSGSELPAAHRGITRSLFALIQVMYLVFYTEALLHWQAVGRIFSISAPIVLVVVLVTAGVGIPVRFYLFFAATFDYAQLADKFQRIFLGILVLDLLWAIAPFLIEPRIGFGPAFGATAALLYVPFAERTLVRMAYRAAPELSG